MLAVIKAAKNKFTRNNTKIVKAKEGKTRIRILPVPVVGSPVSVPGQFWLESAVHWIKTEKGGKPVAVVGNSEVVYGTPSPIDAAIERAIRSASSDEDLEIMKEWKAKKSVLVNAIVRSGVDKSDDPVPFELTPTTFAAILSQIEEYESDHGNILDPKNGFDFTIERVGKGFDTKYTVMPHPSAPPVPKGALEKAVDLFKMVETEYFRGDETKALTAIGNMTGLSMVGLAAPSPRATALLTSAAARVVDAEVEEIAAEIVEAAEEKAAAKVEEDDEAALMAKLAALKAKKAAEVKVKKVEVAEKPADDFGAALDDAAVSKLLDELDTI